MALFASAAHEPLPLALAVLAARTCLPEVRLIVSPETRSQVLEALTGAARWGVVVERLAPEGLDRRLGSRERRRGRCVGAPPAEVVLSAAAASAYLDRSPVLRAARVELLADREAQSVSVEAHRFGMLEPPLPLRGAGGSVHTRI
jgi:hypothetical protein